MTYLVGALSAALLIAVVALVAQHHAHKRFVGLALAQETRALDRAAAAELRSAKQIDAMLDRISTEPRLEIRPTATSTEAPSKERIYIADHSGDDEAWNEYRGEEEDAE